MKKNLFLFSVSLLFSLHLVAQIPQGFNYQAVARNNSGVAIVNQSIGLQINLRQTTSNGAVVYGETHTVTSSNIGLLNLVVGAGTAVTGTFSTIDWSAGPYFIEISMDVTGGTNYVLMGTQQLMSVPYALYAANAGTQGLQGATGVTGPIGVTGSTGLVGATGNMGATGEMGATGVIGATGMAGDVGATGAIGSTGVTGPVGDKYATSSATVLNIEAPSTPLTFFVETGLAYSIGQDVIIAFSSTEQMSGAITSYNSTTGEMNITVATATGSGTGLQPWSVNLKGAPGPAGPIGLIGATGNNGTDGVVGATGAVGATGMTGDVGLTGSTGLIGATGVIGSTGVMGVTGATGEIGATGNNGVAGSTGSTGATGAVGATGADATFAVQFNVVSNGSASYLFDNASDYVSGANSNPTITLYRGFTYKFNINTGGAHPFRIASTQGGPQFNVGVSSNDVAQGTITFKVPQNAPAQLFYYCVPHFSTMKGTINIQ